MSNAIPLPEPEIESTQIDSVMRVYTIRSHSADQLHAHAAAVTAAKDAEIAGLREDLQFVERWANHHASKPHTTPQEALSVIQHYPPIKAITKGYADGKVPDTFDPFARIKVLEDALRDTLDRMDRARNILTDGKPRPDCNWGMLATEAARAALGDKTP